MNWLMSTPEPFPAGILWSTAPPLDPFAPPSTFDELSKKQFSQEAPPTNQNVLDWTFQKKENTLS